MLTPENYPIILGHEPIAASAIVDTSDAISLENATGVRIIFVHATNSDVDVAITVHEGATAAEAAAGTYPITATFPIWVTTNTSTTDVPARQTDAAGYTIIAHTLTGTSIIQLYVPAAILTNGKSWVHLGTDTGGTGLACVLYELDGERYQQAAPPTAI
jgi:hypothetical protein